MFHDASSLKEHFLPFYCLWTNHDVDYLTQIALLKRYSYLKSPLNFLLMQCKQFKLKLLFQVVMAPERAVNDADVDNEKPIQTLNGSENET